MPPRFHVDGPLPPHALIDLPAGAARHVQVLRLQPGAPIIVFNGEGGESDARVASIGRSEVRVEIGEHRRGRARVAIGRDACRRHAGERAHGHAGREGHRTRRGGNPAAAHRALGVATRRRARRAPPRALASDSGRGMRAVRAHAHAVGRAGAVAERMACGSRPTRLHRLVAESDRRAAARRTAVPACGSATAERPRGGLVVDGGRMPHVLPVSPRSGSARASCERIPRRSPRLAYVALRAR